MTFHESPTPMNRSVLWRDGWYRFAAPCPSPNYGMRPAGRAIDLIVLHCISLPPGQYGGPEVLQLFTNQLDWDQHPYFQSIRDVQVSAHFFIRRDGGLYQLVSCDSRAWHAGVSSYLGRDNCNDNSIGIELEGLDGEPFDTTQYSTLTALCASLLQRYPIEHLAGHEHIAPARKRDPGSGFDWHKLRHALALDQGVFPAA